MADSGESPRVGENSWGHIEVPGFGRFKDVKLWPGGAREWDWDENGTRHDPGIRPEDVEELLAFEVEVVVLSRGRELRLLTMKDTIALLEQRGAELVQAETSEAIAAYNDLADRGRRVAALLHSTC